jgi:hypothetical protein
VSTWMKHPLLPEDQVIEVPDAAVNSHRRSGWETTERPESRLPNPQIEAAEDWVSNAEPDTEIGDDDSVEESAFDPEDAAVDERPTDTTQDGKE